MKFNTKTPGTKTKNLAGGIAYKQSADLELVSVLLTSFANDQFYRSVNDTFDRLKQVIGLCDPEFVAKAAIYARTKFGMRSITHLVASELAKHVSGKEWAKSFYNAVVYRPDDMLEIVSYHKANNGKLTNAMKQGFANAFDKFDGYQLAKYKGEGKSVKLIDIVNLVHPVANEKNGEALRLLVKGELKSTGTWEAGLTQAGQSATSDDEKAEFKKDVWVKLIRENKIGYFALLRNLRNIIEQAPEIVDEALVMLTNEMLIKKSLVLPFRFTTAFEEIHKLTNGPVVRNVLITLNTALDLSLANVPKFEGDTLVVLDVSGSMMGKPSQIGSLFSAILIKANNADFITFSDSAQYRNVNPMDSTITIANSVRFASGGTNFSSAFARANKKYDRIVILSDMQGWKQDYLLRPSFIDYKNRYGANPFLYSFDLQGYGTMQFPEKNVFCLTGFSPEVFKIMEILESDANVMINEIKKIEF